MNPAFKSIQNFYHGFFIHDPLGNNAFSYPQRTNQKIFVAPLMPGNLNDLAIGEEIAFSEMEEGREINRAGLKNFIYWNPGAKKHIFIFDNHNHAFFFWMYALKSRAFPPGLTLVHVDQHRDMREPQIPLIADHWQKLSLREAFDYTNFQLNVGNFLKPALALNIFSGVQFIDRTEMFSTHLPDHFILDLDMDVFSPVMNYIDEEFKIEKIRGYIARADFITISTSPFFMDQKIALQLIKKIFDHFVT